MPRDIQTQLKIIPRPAAGLDLALEIFITAKQAERCTPRTIQTYRWTLEKFLAWLRAQDVTDAAAISAHHVRLFLAELDKGGAKASYTHTFAKIIKTWLRFLYAEELILVDPTGRVKMPRQDHEILPAFTSEDVRKLLDACRTAREMALVLCLLDSGCRAAEFCALKVGDVDVKTGTIVIRQGVKSRASLYHSCAAKVCQGSWRTPCDSLRLSLCVR